MYRLSFAIAFGLVCIGHLLAREVDSQESTISTRSVQIVEIALPDEVAAKPEDIALNYQKYVTEGKGKIIQILSLTAIDGHNVGVSKSADELLLRSVTPSGGFQTEDTLLQSVPYWLGFLVELDTKSNKKGIQLKLVFEHAFVPGLSPDSKESEVIGVTVEKTIELLGNNPVAIEAKVSNQNAKSWGKKVYLVVSIKPTSN